METQISSPRQLQVCRATEEHTIRGISEKASGSRAAVGRWEVWGRDHGIAIEAEALARRWSATAHRWAR